MPQKWHEELNKRNRTSKTKRLYVDGQPTNKYSWDGFAGAPMHYQDIQGDWQDIDTILVPSTRSITGFGNPAWEMVENEYEMFVLGKLNSGVPLVRYQVKHGDYYVQFAPHSLEWSNDLDQLQLISIPATTQTAATDSEARWFECYGAGRDLRFIAGAGRMGKWLDIAAALPAPPQFIIDGGNPVIQFSEILEFHKDLDVYVNGKLWNKRDKVATTQAIEFRSPNGEVQFVFPVATAYHEGGPPDIEEADYIDNGVIGETRLKKQGPNLYITARFPWSWFQTDDFAYPLHLDATVDKQVNQSEDDGYYTEGNALVIASQTAYLGQLTGKNRECFARWTGVTISGTIGTAYIELYAHNNGAGGALLKVRGVDEDNPPAPTTAEEYLADPLTDAAVDWDETFTIDTWEGSDIELKTIFQELVDSYTISNDAVMVQVKDDGSGNNNYNQCRQFDFGAGAQAPKLHIEYSVGAAIVKIMSSTLGVSEAELYRNRAVRLITETVSLADSFVRRMWSIRPLAEVIGIADGLLRKGSLVKLAAETVGIIETFIKSTFTSIVKLMAETVGIGDAMLKIAGMVRVASETVGITDGLLRRLHSMRQMVETVSLQDAVVRRMWSIRMKAETISIQDSFARALATVREMAEIIGITEGVVRIMGFARMMAETVSIIETKLRVAGFAMMMAETVGLAESFVQRFYAARQMMETVNLTDAAVRRAWMIRLLSSMVSIQDAILKRAWSVRMFAETVSILDSATRRARAVRIATTETINIIETALLTTAAALARWALEMLAPSRRDVETRAPMGRDSEMDGEM